MKRLGYGISRLIWRVRQAVWAWNRERIWKHEAARDQLDQVIWRLEMGASTVDQIAALNLARTLRNKVYG